MNSNKTESPVKFTCAGLGRDLVITIDGPAGAGKTTVSKMIAQRLDYRYIDTGALYRGVAYATRNAGIAKDDDAGLEKLCRTLVLDLKSSPQGLRLYCQGEEITDHLRTPDITMLASAVSARKPVRRYLLDIQRNFGKDKRVVIEGRDTGTVIFPEADVKFFLMASASARALRRFQQTQGQTDQSLEQVALDMRRRDDDDSTRDLAPLTPADDAILIDSTMLGLDDVIEIMLDHVRRISVPLAP